jgi:hypothetical protein
MRTLRLGGERYPRNAFPGWGEALTVRERFPVGTEFLPHYPKTRKAGRSGVPDAGCGPPWLVPVTPGMELYFMGVAESKPL